MSVSIFMSPAKRSVLFVVIAIGEKYKAEYLELFHASHQRYCLKHGYDFFLVEDFIKSGETDKSLISLQKILVCSLDQAKEYDLVVFMDSDILINHRIAPPIEEYIGDSEYVYLVDEYSQPSKEGRLHINKKMGWEDSAAAYYKLCDFKIETETVLNTGIMILNPNIHASVCERIYQDGVRHGRGHPRGFHYEQSLIGFTFQKIGLYRKLDNKWNAIFALHLFFNKRWFKSKKKLFLEFYKQNYFIHFAGSLHKGLEKTIKSLSLEDDTNTKKID